MRKTLCRQLILAACLLALTGSLGAQSTRRPQGFTWWKSDEIKKDLGLTADQSVRIDKIWETTRPELRQEWDELSRLEQKLSRLIQSDTDEATLTRQIDRVETARMNGNKTRSLMLVQMLKVLTPDQRLRLKNLHERWEQDPAHKLPNGSDVPKQPGE